MASPFDKSPASKPADKSADPYAREHIDREIAHLRQRGTVRYAEGGARGLRAAWPSILIVLVVLGLFLMDPVLHSFRRAEAIRVYLYLHQLGNDHKSAELASTGIFNPTEVELLNLRQGPFQEYYPGPTAADHAADSIIGYLKGVSDLRAGAYDQLDLLGKIRYELFVRWGLLPPQTWSILDPSIRE